MRLTDLECQQQFSIVPNKIPSDNVRRVLNQVKETAHLNVVPDLEDHEPEIITALQHQNLYQSIKDDSKRLAKILSKSILITTIGL